jgi:hypothetical protein
VTKVTTAAATSASRPNKEMICSRDERQRFRLRAVFYEFLEHWQRTDMILVTGHE